MAAAKRAPTQARAKPQIFTDAQKAEAVARVAAGDAVTRVAKDLGVVPSTIRLWRAQAGGDPKKADPDFRALILEHLELGIAAASRILRQTEHEAWLREQSAHDLAVLYGTIFDKAARVLAALGDGGEPGTDQVDTGAPGLPAPG